MGCISGHKTDKSDAFPYHAGAAGAPTIDEAPVVMERIADDIYETEGIESFICKIASVRNDEPVLTEAGKIDYRKLKSVLFEMPTYEYFQTGEVIDKCMSFDK